MKCTLLGLIFCLLLGCVVTDNFSFTYDMIKRCKEHLCQHGYSYDTFYRVDSNDHKAKGDGAVFEMHLAILAASNGHILLSTVPHPEASDPVYEIVVGGGANKFTELRRNLRRNARTSAKTVGILSAIEYRAFYIRINEDGVIEFGREGDNLTVLTYTDVSPISIQYFSFAAWNGVEAKFLYDCPAPGDNAAAPNSREVERKLSNSDQLKRTLLLDRMPDLPPGPTVKIKMGVRFTSVRYNVFESKLSTGLAIVASWTDDSMAWNPSKFNGTTRLTFFQGQIWRPTFFVFNSDDMGVLDTKNPELIAMSYSGEATFHFQTNINTWCSETENLNTWPNDRYTCSIVMGAWQAHENLTIEEIAPDDPKMMVFADIDNVIHNEWDMSIKKAIVAGSVWNMLFALQDNQTHQSDRFLWNISLRRRATAYNIVFYTPLLVLVTFVLLSFWSEPLQISRVWFYAGAVTFICSGLCYIDYLVPCHTVPSILILYTTVLAGILVALLLQIVLMTTVTEKLCKTVFVQALLTSKWFRMIFCLPAMKTCRIYESVNEAYHVQEDDDSGVISPRYSNVEEMQTDSTTCSEKVELAGAIDKLMFTAYSVTFAVMLALHF